MRMRFCLKLEPNGLSLVDRLTVGEVFEAKRKNVMHFSPRKSAILPSHFPRTATLRPGEKAWFLIVPKGFKRRFSVSQDI